MARRRSKTKGLVSWDISIAGIPHMQALLAAMPRTLQSGIVVPIVRTLTSTGAKIARQELKRALPLRDYHGRRWQTPTGALRDSLGSKVVAQSRMKNKDISYGVFGARTDFRVSRATGRNVSRIRSVGVAGFYRPGNRIMGPLGVGRVTDAKGRRRAPRGFIQPHKYIHFVEFGHRRGDGPTAADPYPFIRPTRRRLSAIAPTLIRERWATLYPQQIAKMKRRYMRQADIARQVQEFQRRGGMR